MIELFLDTTEAKIAKVKISNNGIAIVEIDGIEPLPTIQEALQKAELKLDEVGSFKANPGPGSYTGIRIGLAIVNALNWAFGKNVKAEEPKYQ